MSVFSALYTLLIGPLELLFEFIFTSAFHLLHNPGTSIIVLSLAVNFLVLPLYKRADAMQAQQRDTEMRLKPWADHIRRTFTGDERFMILQTYYRQNGYRPSSVLKGSLSLLLEIPFFMAAYNFLSSLELLQGVSFGPIANLGVPDAMLTLGTFSVNVLPIAMTVINLISGAVYMKGFPLKNKLQMYLMALLFLVLLYDSPAGLVFYWTLNNVFSLVKNIFYRLREPKKVFNILLSATGIGGLIAFFVYHPFTDLSSRLLLIGALLLLQLPLLLQLTAKKRRPAAPAAQPRSRSLFFLSCAFLVLLTGLLIPSAVIKASPLEFLDTSTFTSPLWYVLNALLLAAGTFGVWCSVFYFLASPGGRRVMSLVSCILAGTAFLNYMFFGTHYGVLSAKLRYVQPPVMVHTLLNFLLVLAVGVLLWLVWKKKEQLLRGLFAVLSAAAIVLSMLNITGTQQVLAQSSENLHSEAQTDLARLTLSKTGKNVVVIMMDRAVGSYIPFLMAEKPELQQQFAGFTYYPNTLSFGNNTISASPALYGGYAYTPREMNRRDQESLKDKHNEALTTMPVLFDRAGFAVTVCDPTYANYQWIPDLSVFDPYPDIRRYNTMGNFYYYTTPEQMSRDTAETLNRNFFCYSLFRSSPVFFQPFLYTDGTYGASQISTQVPDGPSKAHGLYSPFLRAYAVLDALPEITEYTDDPENTFLMMSNDTTHEPMMLQLPDYVPAEHIDNTGLDSLHRQGFTVNGHTLHMDTEVQIGHYHANMAAMLKLGSWLDTLRENGVYDNTRIILVSDHGFCLGQMEDRLLGSGRGEDTMSYNPLLMVKDFGATEFTVDEQFMTNADVPTLATGGLVENPVSPFTGRPITSEAKNAPEQQVFYTDFFDPTMNNGCTYRPDLWFSVHDDVRRTENWSAIPDPCG